MFSVFVQEAKKKKKSFYIFKIVQISLAPSPQELHAGWTQGDDPAGQPLSLHQRRGAGQLLRLHQAAGDAGGCRTGPRRYDDTQTVMPAASHWATPSVDHKTNQEPVFGQKTSHWLPVHILNDKVKCETKWNETFSSDPVCMGLATGLTLSDVSVAGLLGISESSSYSLGSGSGVCCYKRKKDDNCSWHSQNNTEYHWTQKWIMLHLFNVIQGELWWKIIPLYS